MCVFIFIESKAVESGEGETQSSSYLMLTSAAGLNIIRHLQENSLCELSLQYLFEVCVQVLSLQTSSNCNGDLKAIIAQELGTFGFL